MLALADKLERIKREKEELIFQITFFVYKFEVVIFAEDSPYECRISLQDFGLKILCLILEPKKLRFAANGAQLLQNRTPELLP